MSQQRSLDDLERERQKTEQEARFELRGNTVRVNLVDDQGNDRGYIQMKDLGDRVEIYCSTETKMVISHQASNVFQVGPVDCLLKPKN